MDSGERQECFKEVPPKQRGRSWFEEPSEHTYIITREPARLPRARRTQVDAPETVFFAINGEGAPVIPVDGDEGLTLTRQNAREIKYEGERIARYVFTGYVR